MTAPNTFNTRDLFQKHLSPKNSSKLAKLLETTLLVIKEQMTSAFLF